MALASARLAHRRGAVALHAGGGGGRKDHRQFRQRRHPVGDQGGGPADGQELHPRPARDRHREHRVRPARVEGSALPDFPFRASRAGLCRGRGRRLREDRPRGRGQDERGARGRAGGARAGRPHRHAGLHLAERQRGAARSGAAPARDGQQLHRRLPQQQRDRHHRLRRERAAHPAHHPGDRPAGRGRRADRAAAERLGDRYRADPAARDSRDLSAALRSRLTPEGGGCGRSAHQ